LSPDVRQSPTLYVKVDQQAKRREEYRSDNRLPSQSVWGYLTKRIAGAVIDDELDLRFQSSLLTIWDQPSQRILEAICVSSNAIYSDVINELARKPSVPPLPPPLIQLTNKFGLVDVQRLSRPTSISITSLYESDFDVTLYYDSAPPSGNPCVSVNLPFPPTPPLEPQLPSRAGSDALPAPFPVGNLPPGSLPIGGTSSVAPDALPSDNYLPPEPPPPPDDDDFYEVTVTVSYRGCQSSVSGELSAPLVAAYTVSQYLPLGVQKPISVEVVPGALADCGPGGKNTGLLKFNHRGGSYTQQTFSGAGLIDMSITNVALTLR
jgi:hypothetical protein